MRKAQGFSQQHLQAKSSRRAGRDRTQHSSAYPELHGWQGEVCKLNLKSNPSPTRVLPASLENHHPPRKAQAARLVRADLLLQTPSQRDRADSKPCRNATLTFTNLIFPLPLSSPGCSRSRTFIAVYHQDRRRGPGEAAGSGRAP